MMRGVFQVGELGTWLGGFINISGMYKKGCRSGGTMCL
jgi:hypothetical protein